MKNAILSAGFILMAMFAVNAQESAPASTAEIGGAQIEFEKEVHDFGTMKQYGDASCEFKITNTGTEPLVITNCKGSCGCTVPACPKQAILPGQSNVIKVKYDSKRIGPINKSVTVTSNASNAPTKVIRIKGKIDAAPQENTTLPINDAPQAAPTESN